MSQASSRRQHGRRIQLEVERLESREVPAGGLQHHFAANMVDPTGHADGVQRVSWSEPGMPTTVNVFLNSRTGGNRLTLAQKAAIRSAMAQINRTWDGVNGLRLVEVPSAADAHIRVQNSGTSRIGGVAEGVLGLADYHTFDTGLKGTDGKVFHRFVGAQFGAAYQVKVTMITGWNWYTGARPAGIGRTQYDYQTIVTHELAHAVGLEHDTRSYAGINGDGKSVMLPWGIAGRPHRRLSPHDLASLRYLYASAPAPSEGGFRATGNAATTWPAQTQQTAAGLTAFVFARTSCFNDIQVMAESRVTQPLERRGYHGSNSQEPKATSDDHGTDKNLHLPSGEQISDDACAGDGRIRERFFATVVSIAEPLVVQAQLMQ
ncbi:MAG: hypothetical protein FJ271_24030 [Planctomycetes bacterium]|nr:hypothetical protein [Planctomycetota bacterium]